MEIRLDSKLIKNIEKTSVVQQSAFWAKIKGKSGMMSRAFDVKVKESELCSNRERDNYIKDDLLILFPEIGGGRTIGYIPYGPTLDPGPDLQGEFLEELSESLRPHLPGSCVMVRYDLLWESPWAQEESFYGENGNWMGPPAKKSQEIRLNYATHNWNLRKSSTDVLPTDTIFLDLTLDEETLLRNMKPKTRYNIRLSGRKGVIVREADTAGLPLWYSLYSETCKRNGIYRESPEYFSTVLTTDSGDTRSPAEVKLLIAELEGKPLAAMFLVFSRNRATYLYGASSSSDRSAMATYALQWEAVKTARRRGMTEYDMFGISPFNDPGHPLYGLYRFKKGFGGEIFHRMGCWDYPFDRTGYQRYLTAEIKSPGYHSSTGRE